MFGKNYSLFGPLTKNGTIPPIITQKQVTISNGIPIGCIFQETIFVDFLNLDKTKKNI